MRSYQQVTLKETVRREGSKLPCCLPHFYQQFSFSSMLPGFVIAPSFVLLVPNVYEAVTFSCWNQPKLNVFSQVQRRLRAYGKLRMTCSEQSFRLYHVWNTLLSKRPPFPSPHPTKIPANIEANGRWRLHWRDMNLLCLQCHIPDGMAAEPFLSKLDYFFLNYYLLFVGEVSKSFCVFAGIAKQHGANAGLKWGLKTWTVVTGETARKLNSHWGYTRTVS